MSHEKYDVVIETVYGGYVAYLQGEFLEGTGRSPAEALTQLAQQLAAVEASTEKVPFAGERRREVA